MQYFHEKKRSENKGNVDNKNFVELFLNARK